MVKGLNCVEPESLHRPVVVQKNIQSLFFSVKFHILGFIFPSRLHFWFLFSWKFPQNTGDFKLW